MQYNITTLFLLFYIYSTLGYIVESLSVSAIEKKAVFSRGFLIGPYLPIFGFGGLFMTLTLQKYSDDLIALFIMSMTGCLILEYLSSYILEKIFKLRWWDYSEKKFNLNGRICLEVGVMFGLAGVGTIKFINPLIKILFNLIPNTILTVIVLLLATIILTDIYFSTKIIIKFGKNFAEYSKDSSIEMKAKIMEELSKNSFFIKRLLKSFPDAKDKLNKYHELREEYYEKLKVKYKNTK